MGDRTHNVEISCGMLQDRKLSVYDMTQHQVEDMLQMVRYFDNGQRPQVGQTLLKEADNRTSYKIMEVIDNPSIEPNNPWDTTVIVRAEA